MDLEFRILGEVGLRRGGVEADLGGRRPRALFALLLVERGRPVLVETAIDRLWPDEPPDSAAKTVQVYVSRLRSTLGPARERLRSTKGGYALEVGRGELDAGAFVDEIGRGRDHLAAGDVDGAVGALDSALGRWRGRPFGDLADEPFLRPETQRLEDLEANAQELRAQALVTTGRATEAIGPLRRLVSDYPERESAWTRLVLSLYAAGRQADALAAFHEIRTYLDEELGIEPGPELQAAHIAVLQQSAPIALPAHALAAVLEPAKAAAPAKPTPGSALVGRDEDLLALDAALDAGSRLITLTGPGGIGKTTLCREVLARRRPGAEKQVAFIELEAIRDPDLVPAAVAAALGSGGSSAVEQLGSTAALLGLDNLEQVISAAPWVADVLRACPRVKIVATSREPLGLAAERVYPVRPLEPDASRELFLARARLVRRDLNPSPEIDAVCARLDQLPLAIELAAARTSLMSPQSLLSRLDRVLDVLGETPRYHADRQRTLRSTIAWSYDLLDPGLQRVFRRMSIFVGGFSLEAAEAIADAALDDVEKLLGQSLVTARYASWAEPRFAMLETIREFGLERLIADDDAALVRSGHLRWFRRLASAADDGSRHAGAEPAELSIELDNLRAAMAWATEVGDDEARWQIAVGLSDVWQTRGHLAEARRWLEDGLEEAEIPDDLRAEALDDASTMAFRQGRLDEFQALAEQLLALARSLDLRRRMVAALAKLAQIALRSGDAERARALNDEALALAAGDADRRPLLVSLSSQANADLLAGHAEAAATAFEACLAIAREVGRPESIATSCFNVGLAKLVDGRDRASARIALREALDRYMAMEDVEGVAYVLVAVGGLLVTSDPAAAGRALGASHAALASVGASLEAVETQLQERIERRARDAIGAERLAAEVRAGSAEPDDAWAALALMGLEFETG